MTSKGDDIETKTDSLAGSPIRNGVPPERHDYNPSQHEIDPFKNPSTQLLILQQMISKKENDISSMQTQISKNRIRIATTKTFLTCFVVFLVIMGLYTFAIDIKNKMNNGEQTCVAPSSNESVIENMSPSDVCRLIKQKTNPEYEEEWVRFCLLPEQLNEKDTQIRELTVKSNQCKTDNQNAMVQLVNAQQLNRNLTETVNIQTQSLSSTITRLMTKNDVLGQCEEQKTLYKGKLKNERANSSRILIEYKDQKKRWLEDKANLTQTIRKLETELSETIIELQHCRDTMAKQAEEFDKYLQTLNTDCNEDTTEQAVSNHVNEPVGDTGVAVQDKQEESSKPKKKGINKKKKPDPKYGSSSSGKHRKQNKNTKSPSRNR